MTLAWFIFGMICGLPLGLWIFGWAVRRTVRREVSSDYNASLPDWPHKPTAPMSLTSSNAITFFVFLGIALLFVLAYAASR